MRYDEFNPAHWYNIYRGKGRRNIPVTDILGNLWYSITEIR